MTLSPASVAENSPVGTVIGRLRAIDSDDPDGLDAYQFALVDSADTAMSNDNGLFELDGEFLRAKVILDHEEAPERVVRIQVTDNKGGVLETDLVIRVVDRREEEPESQPEELEPEAPGWIADAQLMEHGWFQSAWFGSFYFADNHWIFHADFGWLHAVGDGTGGVWLWDHQYGWLWTRHDVFPHLHHHQGADWLYFIKQAGAQRAFFNYSTQSFEFR